MLGKLLFRLLEMISAWHVRVTDKKVVLVDQIDNVVRRTLWQVSDDSVGAI